MLKKVFVSHQFLRQCLAAAISGWLSFTTGLAIGFTATAEVPVLQKDTGFALDDTIISWIASITPLSMILGCLCAGPIIDGLGRKAGHIILAILSLFSWFFLEFANNYNLLLIGRFIAGLSIGGNRPVSLVYLGEITEPKYRSLLILFPLFLPSVSILVSHLMGEYLYWRICCFIYAATNLVALVLILFLKESPIWLITKGKISEGKQSFIWLRGEEMEAENELNLILQRQDEKNVECYMKDILNIAFLKALVTALLLAIAAQFCGVNLFFFYAIDISRNTFKRDIDPFVLMIVLDVVRIFSVVVNLACNRYISSRKKSFFIINVICSFVLLVLFIYLLHTFRSLWLSIILEVLYLALGSSVITFAWSFIPELFPSTLRGLGSSIASSMSYFLLFIIVKIYPWFTAMFGQEAMYISCAVLIILNSIILHFLLPETHSRTSQDLENSYNKNRE